MVHSPDDTGRPATIWRRHRRYLRHERDLLAGTCVGTPCARAGPPSGAGRIWYWSCPSWAVSSAEEFAQAASRFSPPQDCWTCWPSAASAEHRRPSADREGSGEQCFSSGLESGADQGGHVAALPPPASGLLPPCFPHRMLPCCPTPTTPLGSNTAGRCCV